MKKISVIWGILSLIYAISFAQPGSIEGTITETAESQPLAFASVSLFSSLDSALLQGSLADSSGRFEINKLSAGEYYLEVRFLGYETVIVSNVKLNRGQQLQLGFITLKASPLLLEEIEISGRKRASFHRIDRQVYSASQFRQAQGGSALEVLVNLPSVSVNSQQEISVRGANGFVIMVNGKPLQSDPLAFLYQLPADAIEDIEIITAPSARYDPDGKAGIINIKTRRTALDGIYISANVRWGLPSIEPYENAESARRFGADVTLNYKTGKWDMAFGLDYRRNDVSGRRVGYVNTYMNEVLTEFPSDGERSFDRTNYSGRASVSYSPNDNQSFGASFYAGKRTQFRTADILYLNQQRTLLPNNQFLGPEAYWDLYRQTGQVLPGGVKLDSLTYFNENLRVRRGDFLIGSLDYSHTFQDQSSLKITALYEHTILGGPTDNINLDWPNTLDTLQLQFNDNDNPLDGVRLQLDYSRKIGEATLESGYQYRFLFHPGDFIYLERDFETNTWEVNPEFTNRIELRRQIHSVYSQLSGQKGPLTYTVGLRLEYFDREVHTATPDTSYFLDQINPFPSVNLQYDLGGQLFAKAAYSRRIERTTTFKMTPFPEREHSETLEQGDAELLPEFIDLVEAGLVKNWGDNNLFVSGYYRHVKNVINRVNTIYNDTILNRIYTNAGNAQVWGIEAGTSLAPTPWWSIYAGGNIYRYQIKGTLFGDEINTANTIYSINANTSFQILPTLDLQLGINYLSERVTAQGVDSRFYNPNLTLRKSFPDQKLTVTFQWQNMDMGLLNANEQRITTVRDDFYTTTNYVYEVDILMLGISYRLNQPSKKAKLIRSEFGDKEF